MSQLTDTLRDGTVDNLLVVLESGGRIAARARHARNGDVTTLDNAIYSPCPVTSRQRLPEAAELGDHRGAGDRRSRRTARPLRGRPAAAVRRQPAAAADLQHRARHRAARPAGWCPTSAFRASKGFELALALPLADRAQPRPDAHAARLHRRPARRSKPSIASSTASARSRSAASSPTGRSTTSIPTATVRRRKGFRGYFEANGKFQLDPAVEHHQPRSASRATRPSPAATTSPTTTGCATSSTPSGSRPIAISRSPAGRSRACASTTTRSRSRSRFRRSTRASASTTSPAASSSCRPTASSITAHRRPGHAARLRQRAMGPAAADPVGPGSRR